jgi:hypothetical protein
MIYTIEVFGTLEFKICDMYYSGGKTIEFIAKELGKRMSFVSSVVTECKEDYDKTKASQEASALLPKTERHEKSNEINEYMEEKLEIFVFKEFPDQFMKQKESIMEEELNLNIIASEIYDMNSMEAEEKKALGNNEIPLQTEEDINLYMAGQKAKEKDMKLAGNRLNLLQKVALAKKSNFVKKIDLYKTAIDMLGVESGKKDKKVINNNKISVSMNIKSNTPKLKTVSS